MKTTILAPRASLKHTFQLGICKVSCKVMKLWKCMNVVKILFPHKEHFYKAFSIGKTFYNKDSWFCAVSTQESWFSYGDSCVVKSTRIMIVVMLQPKRMTILVLGLRKRTISWDLCCTTQASWFLCCSHLRNSPQTLENQNTPKSLYYLFTLNLNDLVAGFFWFRLKYASLP